MAGITLGLGLIQEVALAVEVRGGRVAGRASRPLLTADMAASLLQAQASRAKRLSGP